MPMFLCLLGFLGLQPILPNTSVAQQHSSRLRPQEIASNTTDGSIKVPHQCLVTSLPPTQKSNVSQLHNLPESALCGSAGYLRKQTTVKLYPSLHMPLPALNWPLLGVAQTNMQLCILTWKTHYSHCKAKPQSTNLALANPSQP